MKVVGIDPGATTGYGVIGRERDGALFLRECGVIRTDPAEAFPSRLRRIYDGVVEVIERHEPDEVAVEGVFYARNARTALILGQTRGVILLAAALREVPVAEYSPAEVKSAIAGTGRAAKEQIQYMVQRLLRLKSPPRPADAADAVAIALCHCHASGLAGALAAANARGFGRR